MRRVGALLLFIIVLLFVLPLVFIRHGKDEYPKDIHTDDDLRIQVYDCEAGETRDMALEDYILGVVAGEMPADFHIEALKAQVLAARTYTLLRMRQMGGRGCSVHPGADICTDSTHCQAYRDLKTVRKNLDKLKQAVQETAGQIIVYDGKPIDAVFHSTSGGKTENSEEVWSSQVPYLRSVMSQFEEHSPKYITKKEVEITAFISSMKELTPGIQINRKNLKNEIKVLERSEGGRITQIKIGNKVLKGTDIRNKLGLNSANFNCQVNKNTILFTVIGYGHGIGMSQYGADGMAKNGYAYDAIVRHYYQGVEIAEVHDLLNAAAVLNEGK